MSHFPPRWQWTELRNSLRLYRSTLTIRAHDTVCRLSSWIHPSGRTRVKIHIVWQTVRRVPFLPSGGQITRASRSGTTTGTKYCGVPRLCTRNSRALRIGTTACSLEQVVHKDPAAVLISCSICLAFLGVMIDSLVRERAIPCNIACIVVDIVSQTEKINSTFPSLRKWTILFLVGIEVMLGIGDWPSRGDNTRCGRSRWVLRM